MKSIVISGGCLCGAVRYEARGQPYNIAHCQCLDCRRSSGAAFVTWASFRRSEVRFRTGQPREIRWAGRIRTFCADCGTPLTFLAKAEAEEMDLTVCSFDHPESVTPGDHTWVEDRLPWISTNDDLQSYKRKREARGERG